jgi:hypothetical protein
MTTTTARQGDEMDKGQRGRRSRPLDFQGRFGLDPSCRACVNARRCDAMCPGTGKRPLVLSGITSCRHSSAGVIARSSDAAAARNRELRGTVEEPACSGLHGDPSSQLVTQKSRSTVHGNGADAARKWGETRSKSTARSVAGGGRSRQSLWLWRPRGTRRSTGPFRCAGVKCQLASVEP